MRKLVGGALLSGVLLIGLAAPAQGATTIGQTFTPAPGGCPINDITAFQTGSANATNEYAAPSAGVITSWSYRTDASPPASLKLKVGRADPTAPNFKIIGTDASDSAPAANALNTYAAQISVQAGDVIGFYQPAPTACGQPAAGYSVHFLVGTEPTNGTTSNYSSTTGQLDISAQLEADNDSDGLGDDTQDPDDDNDTVPDVSDNCQLTSNFDQTNTDGDAQGDICDPDDDNDTVNDLSDNCPAGVTGPGNDPDGDGCKNSEDLDDDGDTVADTSDNCSLVANTNQTNTDGDAEGDACDADDDNDTVNDGTDNCQLVANTNQTNTDGDAQGDACDADDDNDGVDDTADGCPTEAAATADGCPLKPGPPDTTPPDVKINSGPAGKTKDTTPTFTFSSTDASAHFTCSVDGKPATSCSSPFTTSKLKKGKHTFAVVATDAAGNASAPASQTFTVKKKKKHHH
jgi:hypothetical protein